MEPDTRRLIKYILLEFAVFLILLAILLYLIQYFDLDFRTVEMKEFFTDLLPKIIGVILVFVLTKLILSLLRPVFDKAFEKHVRSHAEIKMIWRLTANIVWIFMIVLLISIAIGDFTGLLAFGVVAAALVYVLSKPILNMAAWLDIIFHRPYSIGDRIEIDGKKGYVVDVGMFHTTMREFGEWMHGDTYTGRLVTVPNSSIFESPILNYTKDTPFIWDEIKIAITYESDHDRAKQHILDSAAEVVGDNMKLNSRYITRKMDIKDLRRDLLNEPVVRTEFSDSSVNFYLIYFCETDKRRAIKSDISERILARIKKDKKVHVAYPHMEVVGVKKT
jgi:small-conductance mechanosensitive channel